MRKERKGKKIILEKDVEDENKAKKCLDKIGRI